MTVRPRTVKVGDTIVEAAKAMRGEDSGIVPIVDGCRLVGVLTDRDIVTRVIAAEKNPSTVKVEDIASEKLVTIDPDQDLDEALRLMAQHQVRRLPVVEEDGTLIGIVARGDLVRLARTDAAVELISE
jgi:CBS domain-containing protein